MTSSPPPAPSDTTAEPFPDAAAEPGPAATGFQLLPLHRVSELEWHPAEAVIVFNTHAEADAAQALLPETVTVGWDGDPQAIDQYDWTPLTNRQVFIWPAATHRSKDLALRLLHAIKHAVILRTPTDWSRPGLSVGLDIAAASSCGFSPTEARTHLAVELQRIEDEYEATRRADAAEAPTPDTGEPVLLPQELIRDGLDTAPFRVLGHETGQFYYLPSGTQQVVRLGTTEHVRSNLVALAPTSFWQENFSAKPPAVDWHSAGEAMVRRAERVGLFDPSIVRGRGCWIDPTTPTPELPIPRVVFHAGNQIISGHKTYSLTDFPSRFVYERGPELAPDTAPAMTSTESKKFETLCSSLSWRAPLYGKLLAGWCMAASVCGALRWRPHIWVTGSAGAGKSWTVENIVNRFLDRFALSALSATTEAGMRQAIGRDAMPVVLDEAESEDERGRSRFKSILDLVRQASSESGGSIYKGSMSGTAVEFRVRSCFCFSSIGVAAVVRADTSRITVLTLIPRPPEENEAKFELTKALARETVLQPAYAAALRARAISLALEIRQNAETFSHAVALRLGDNRTGDQLGALLAGAYALSSVKCISLEDARAWVALQDWDEFVPADVDKDETRALSTLTDALLRVETNNGPLTTSIGNLLEKHYDPISGPEDRLFAHQQLVLRGVKPMGAYVDVSCSHSELAKIFKETPWGGKWKDQLTRLSGTKESVIKSAKFGTSFHRAVRLPVSIFGLDPLPIPDESGAAEAGLRSDQKSGDLGF